MQHRLRGKTANTE